MLLFVLVAIAMMVTAVFNIRTFLAQTDPVPAEVLVVEGWVPDFVLAEAALEFKRGNYSRLYVTGGPIDHGAALFAYGSYAELGAATLIKMGVNSSVVEAVAAPQVKRDRTYVSALALKSRLGKPGSALTGLNLVSLGVHARRSHLLFQQAFGGDLRVGVFAVEDRNYDGQRWWKFSEGVRAVANESFAYIYALIVFPFIEP